MTFSLVEKEGPQVSTLDTVSVSDLGSVLYLTSIEARPRRLSSLQWHSDAYDLTVDQCTSFADHELELATAVVIA